MGIYLDERAARDMAEISHELRAAQTVLDRHLLDLAGKCAECGGHGCRYREAALWRFSRYSRLPVRVPMATGPGRLFARRVAVTE